MTIARYCGGLFLALSCAAVGAAVGCNEPVGDSEDIREETVGEEDRALSGAAPATGERSDGKDRDKDEDKDKDKHCDEWVTWSSGARQGLQEGLG